MPLTSDILIALLSFALGYFVGFFKARHIYHRRKRQAQRLEIVEDEAQSQDT